VIPIHELLNRIRWDHRFGAAQFAIGYYDRTMDAIIVVPFGSLTFTPDDHFNFTLIDEEGAVHTIPLHRIRQVFRDGEMIWQRQMGES
jgi:uncharacterized protein (UPF0248 family)